MILKVGDEYIISKLRTSNTIDGFGNKGWSEDLKIFYSYTTLTHAIKTYLLPLLRFSSIMATFEIFPQQKLGIDKYAHIEL